MKVYCYNCKYHNLLSINLDCKRFKGSSRRDTPYNIIKKYYRYTGFDLNINNECKYYKRKWWKFWIKKEK